MPYINLNGQLTQVTQEEYNLWTVGQNQNQVGTPQNPTQVAEAVAAGGNVTSTNTATATILTPNTVDTSPGQTLETTYQQAVTSNTTDANTSGYVSTSVVTISDSLVANSSSSITSAANSGLTADQLTALGGADITDPYIRARLGLPALSDVQTLADTIGNVNFNNVTSTVSNLVTSFGNAVSNISFGDIGNVAGNVVSSFGNAVSNIGDYFSGNTATSISASDIQTLAKEVAGGNVSATDAVVAIDIETATVSTETASAGSGTAVGTDANAVSASDVDTNPASVNADINPQVAVATDNIPPAVDVAPADVSPEVDPQAPAPEPTPIVDGSEINTSPEQSTESGYVAGNQGEVTNDAIAQEPSAYSADQLNAIADAQGVAGEEGNITADTLARDPGSFTADELNAIADAQGVAGDEGTGVSASDVNTDAAATNDPYAAQDAENGANAGTGTESTNTGEGTSSDSANASANIQGQIQNAQAQQTIASQRKQINNADWRVRLRLAPQSNYLYNAPTPGILQPLKVTDGIIFPYTPQIDTSYRANYESYDLTHSNYRGYFYKNSYVDAISIKATFTAQDTNDANYLLAVITFLKSVTKMFYGQDAQRGAPPPLVYLTGLGDYQFKENACVVSQFQYNLPDNVDYIRAGSPNNSGLNFNNIRDRQSVATNSIFGSLNRLAAAFLTKGAITGAGAPPTLGLNRPTYVPTKMDINLTLLPVQSRQQVSKQFSVKEFANGNLIKGGFW